MVKIRDGEYKLTIRADLDRRIEAIVANLSPQTWSRVVKMYKLPPLANSPYARIEFGDIHSNGVYETALGYYTIYWDGSVLRTNHRV